MKKRIRRDGGHRSDDALRVYGTDQLIVERDRKTVDGHPEPLRIVIASFGLLVQLDHVSDPDALQVCPAILIWLSSAVDRIGHLTEIRYAIFEWNRPAGTQEEARNGQRRYGTRYGNGVWVHVGSLWLGGYAKDAETLGYGGDGFGSVR